MIHQSWILKHYVEHSDLLRWRQYSSQPITTAQQKASSSVFSYQSTANFAARAPQIDYETVRELIRWGPIQANDSGLPKHIPPKHASRQVHPEAHSPDSSSRGSTPSRNWDWATPWDLELAAVRWISAHRRASRLSTGPPWGIGPRRKGFGCRDTPVVAGRQPRGRRGSTWCGLRLGWSYDSGRRIYAHSACRSSTHCLHPAATHHLLTMAYLHSPRAASCRRATGSLAGRCLGVAVLAVVTSFPNRIMWMWKRKLELASTRFHYLVGPEGSWVDAQRVGLRLFLQEWSAHSIIKVKGRWCVGVSM
jgi:hypothetical protein